MNATFVIHLPRTVLTVGVCPTLCFYVTVVRCMSGTDSDDLLFSTRREHLLVTHSRSLSILMMYKTGLSAALRTVVTISDSSQL